MEENFMLDLRMYLTLCTFKSTFSMQYRCLDALKRKLLVKLYLVPDLFVVAELSWL